MAIDTARKRASALGAYKPFCFYIVPAGTMAKATSVHQYEGIAAAAASSGFINSPIRAIERDTIRDVPVAP